MRVAVGVAVFVAVDVGVTKTPPKLKLIAKRTNKATTRIATRKKSINLFFMLPLPV